VSRWRGIAALALATLAFEVFGCADGTSPSESVPAYRIGRSDYAAFRENHPDLLEPNYLPFMAHPVAAAGDGHVLVLCRWPDGSMPLPVYVGAPHIPESLQDEFSPRDPDQYVAAATAALEVWERELEGYVRFRRVSRRRDAKLALLLVGEVAPAPDPDHQVLGVARTANACRVVGADAAGTTFAVEFDVPEVRVYLADQHGLLAPDQVEWIALHEIGHALGMRTHSPIPADLMYEVVRDRVTVGGLSTEDVNSFVSLYRLANGTMYARIPEGEPADDAPPRGPEGPPQLALSPYVDPTLGFSIRPPRDWTRVETSQGMVAVDGVMWDNVASFQVIVQRYPTIEDYLERFGTYYLTKGRIRENEFSEVAGRRALRITLEDFEGSVTEYYTFVESGDGRVIVVIADCPSVAAEAFRPWFEAALASLKIWSERSGPRRTGSAKGVAP
jgi:hypothetical protein